ncbi:MAG: universal stress protein [Roseibium sp.]
MSTETITILCAVDFSEDSVAALEWACQQAERDDARLVVLHVVHDPASAPGFYRDPDEDGLRPMEDVAEEMFEEFVTKFRTEHPNTWIPDRAETKIVSGLPSGRIVEVANDMKAEQIVVGSSGHTGLPHIMLGSVAQKVVQIAKIPVTVVKAAEEDPE